MDAVSPISPVGRSGNEPPTDAYIDVTIISGATASSIARIAPYHIVAVQQLTALTSTSISFKAGASDMQMSAVRLDGSAFTVATSTSADVYHVLHPGDIFGMPVVQVIAASAEGANRVIRLILAR